MADDETTDVTEETEAAREPRAGVAVPVWALAVVAALAIGGIGYTIGNDSSDSNLINPIAEVRSAPGEDGTASGECPRPPGFGGPHGNGPGAVPGGPVGPGFGHGGEEDRGERGDQDQDQDQDEESESSF